jgi:hypothetical protein
VVVISWDVESGRPVIHQQYGCGRDVRLKWGMPVPDKSAVLLWIEDALTDQNSGSKQGGSVKKEYVAQLLLLSSKGLPLGKAHFDPDVVVASTPNGILILENGIVGLQGLREQQL